MLQLWNSQTPSLGGLTESECPRCHDEAQLPLGELCRQCRLHINARSRRVALWVSAVSTALVAAYTYARVQPGDETGRLVGMIGVVVWFVLSNTIVRRVMNQWEG